MSSADALGAGAFSDEAYRLGVEDAELYLELVGPADAPAVLYLHGGPGYNSHSFRELMGDELQGYRMIYADQRGAGRSPADPGADLSVAALANDVVSLLDALSLGRVTLLAHGFGAMIAADLLARAPERVERLVWVNPWVDMPALATTLQHLAAQLSGEGAAGSDLDAEVATEVEDETLDDLPPAERVAEAGRAVGGKRLFDALLFSKPSSRLRLEHTDAEGFADLHGGNSNPSRVGLEETAGGEVWSLRADLTPLQRHLRPTVVLVGRDDRSCYPTQAERVLQALPHALFSLLDTAHYPWLDDPDTFTDLLHQALAVPPTEPY